MARRKPGHFPLLISGLATAGILLLGFHLDTNLTAGKTFSRLVWPLGRLMLLIGIGLGVGQFIEASGWTRYPAALAAPLFRFGRLGSRCSAAFTTAFFSGAAANAMLLDFYEETKISRRQLFLANFVNQVPAFFLHLPTTAFIVIPLTGWAGCLYLLITFAATLFRTTLFLIYGRLYLNAPASASDPAAAPSSTPPGKTSRKMWNGLLKKLTRRLVRIAVYVIPIYTAVYVFNTMGGFSYLRDRLADVVVTTVMPVEALSMVILSFVAEFTSGFAAAGALLRAGVISTKQTVLALLMGNLIAFPIRALRHQLPRYLGIFSPKMGTQLLFMGQFFRILSLIIMGIIYYWIG